MSAWTFSAVCFVSFSAAFAGFGRATAAATARPASTPPRRPTAVASPRSSAARWIRNLVPFGRPTAVDPAARAAIAAAVGNENCWSVPERMNGARPELVGTLGSAGSANAGPDSAAIGTKETKAIPAGGPFWWAVWTRTLKAEAIGRITHFMPLSFPENTIHAWPKAARYATQLAEDAKQMRLQTVRCTHCASATGSPSSECKTAPSEAHDSLLLSRNMTGARDREVCNLLRPAKHRHPRQAHFGTTLAHCPAKPGS